jgi:hypothetical protein
MNPEVSIDLSLLRLSTMKDYRDHPKPQDVLLASPIEK